MDIDNNVFYSEITRVNREQINSLQDLLDVIPAQPIPYNKSENETSLFKPRNDKYFIPKKRSRLKVRTVREIRNQFERDNYNFIIEDMEKQQSILLAKIRNGSATDNSTKTLAKKLLNADHPITRTAWQMLNNINPDRNMNPTQLVLWNGRRVRVVGSKGGRNKFVCNYDLGRNDEKKTSGSGLKISMKKKHGLLCNSLNIKFRPGPLRRKKNLDYSHQKYHMGPTEVVKLPKPALDIYSAYGANVEPVMASILNKLRPHDGTITEKWAELAVSVLGTIENNSPVQMHQNCCVTFELSYKCDQNRILMRHEPFNKDDSKSNMSTIPNALSQNEYENLFEIKNIVNKMLDCVEISLNQDKMYPEDIESSRTTPEPLYNVDNSIVKEKNKKKYCELDKLDVTVIQLPKMPTMNPLESCVKSYCNLGCICDSLNYTRPFKQHCGFTKCMFGCKCDSSHSNRGVELMEDDYVEFMPDLIELDEEINGKLAKEEQKFHQTVIVSGKKSILLKSRKRHLKCSKRYAEFYTNIRLQNKQEPLKKILTIVDKKLKCPNVEPWCMVHNLYKCFCRGRFTHTSVFDTIATTSTANLPVSVNNPEDIVKPFPCESSIKNALRPRVRHSRESSEKSCCLVNDNSDVEIIDPANCARTNDFKGRKHSEMYYKVTNNKILEMERNDTHLQKKMQRLMKNILTPNKMTPATSLHSHEVNNSKKSTKKRKVNLRKTTNTDQLNKNTNNTILQKNNTNLIDDGKTAETNPKLSESENLYLQDETEDSNPALNIPFEISGDIYKPLEGHLIPQKFLTPWIAKSYKQFMQQQKNGKSILKRPKRGSIILHLWECLLSRYKSQRNIFMTTTRRPFRIYIATECWKPFFKDCININSIRFEDLSKYPSLVQKLLTNEDSLDNKDYFCILGGWDDCWEIIGSVKKTGSVGDERSCDSDISNHDNDTLSRDSDFPENWCIKEDSDHPDSPIEDSLPKIDKIVTDNGDSQRSKWFLMKIENDFSEIYCHKKGFYVERPKILHAINLARVTRKTVVINKQACSEITNIPFGIYALPYTDEYCVVVGPYEINEPLGLEIVKNKNIFERKSTKGYWISANKVDNLKLLDDPMSFLPSNTVQPGPCSIEAQPKAALQSSDKAAIQPSTSNENNIESKPKGSKTVKPIKIRRTNGFYHLTSNNQVIKKTTTSLTKVRCLGAAIKKKITNDKKSLIIRNFSDGQGINSKEMSTPDLCIEPNDDNEIPQIKITSVYSENVIEIEKNKIEDKKSCMFVLKPEEINKKVADINNVNIDETSLEDKEITGDIKHFLSSKVDSNASVNDVCFISDDEDEIVNSETELWTDVWIQCSNVQNLGWIRGRELEDKLFDIEFPGFDSCQMYSKDEAIDKINEVLSTKFKIPKHVQLRWDVLTFSQAVKHLKGKHKLNINCNSEITEAKIFSALGAVSHIRCVTVEETDTQHLNVISPTPSTSYQVECPSNANVNSEAADFIDRLEHTSRLLEDEGTLLWTETENKQAEIFRSLSVPEELRPEMSETLRGLKAMNDELKTDLTNAVTGQTTSVSDLPNPRD